MLPRLVNVKQDYQAAKLSFPAWCQQKGNLYIGGLSYRYLRKKDSIWHNRRLAIQLHNKEINNAEYLTRYEDFIRSSRWSKLHELRGMKLGCFCQGDDCPAPVLLKLYKEKFKEEYMEFPKKQATLIKYVLDKEEPKMKKICIALMENKKNN